MNALLVSAPLLFAPPRRPRRRPARDRLRRGDCDHRDRARRRRRLRRPPPRRRRGRFRGGGLADPLPGLLRDGRLGAR
ncbi:hypothetical protein [Brachybacterium sp. GPGPB12]|uniref:hypothetical protein n=1 Tax=Brachybacterium sp. GPGPB12 TaxID=3023517 RepID=UPI003134239C